MLLLGLLEDGELEVELDLAIFSVFFSRNWFQTGGVSERVRSMWELRGRWYIHIHDLYLYLWAFLHLPSKPNLCVESLYLSSHLLV